MDLHDKRYYVVDETEPDKPVIVEQQPEEGFGTISEAQGWIASNASAGTWPSGAGRRRFSIQQYSAFFADTARQAGVLDGVEAITGAAEDTAAERMGSEPWPRGEIAALGDFDDWSFDARVLALGGFKIERTVFAAGDEREGDYARIVLRFATGDGLVISPRPDGTMMLAWNYPEGPREQIKHFGEGATPAALVGQAIYQRRRGEGEPVAIVVQAVGREDDVNARLRLTDLGRRQLAEAHETHSD